MNEVQVQSTPNGIVFHPHPENKRFQDLTGKVFSYLTVAGYAGPKRYPAGDVVRFWWCRCCCGNLTKVPAGKLHDDYAKSCGCMLKTLIGLKNSTHGMSKTDEYKIWSGMIKRCHNPRYRAFKDYGGRGITVCDEWRHSFESFYDHMGKRPSRSHSIDRVDNNGNYEPSNCRWATRVCQARNKRSNKLFTFNGENKCISEWSSIFNIRGRILYARLRRGWSFEKAVTTPALDKFVTNLNAHKRHK